jgi:hypothetical protein
MATHAVTNVRTRKQWAEIVAKQWKKATDTAALAVDEALETGRLLVQARDELGDREYGAMLKESGLNVSKAAMLRKLAASPVGQASLTSTTLPQTWTALSELAKLDKNDLANAQERGLITTDTTARASRAIAGTYVEKDGIVGAGKSGAMLPSPNEASEIARKTGRMVAASDGHVYSGATEEEGANHVRRRQQTYGAIDAINTLADCPLGADGWIAQAEAQWLNGLDLGAIDAAIDWLTELRDVLPETQGVVNGK